MSNITVGWDIGGANLKVAVVHAQGVVQQTLEVTCPLWRGVDELISAMQQALLAIDCKQANHVVTMTGELADCFSDRHTGVCEIATIATEMLGKNTLFYAGAEGFLSAQQVDTNTQHIASMNWHASAKWLATRYPNTLLIDIGTTTTDMIPISHAKIAAIGVTDAQRMAHNALVYTGMVRTPLMAVAQKIAFQDQQYHVAAELFSTTADVYRLLGMLPIEHDLTETADGQGKSAIDSARRLARMVGYDLEDHPIKEWMTLAENFKYMQIKQLTLAAETVQALPPKHIVGAGLGAALVKEIASTLHADFVAIETLIQAETPLVAQQTGVSFPAYAVACLAQSIACH